MGRPVPYRQDAFVIFLQIWAARQEVDGFRIDKPQFEALVNFLHSDLEGAASCIRLFVGYSGWGPGQLDDELRGGSWLPALLDPDVLFGEGEESTWRAVIRSIEGMDGLSHLPPDSSWN